MIKTKNWQMTISRYIFISIISSIPVFGFSQVKDSIDKLNKISFKQGGDIRVQYFHFDNQNWKKENASNYLSTRFLWNAALHVGACHHYKVEFQIGLAKGSPNALSP